MGRRARRVSYKLVRGVYLTFFRFFLGWKQEPKLREAGRCRLSTMCLVPVAKEVVVWFPGLVAADGGQSSVVICGLAIVSLYIQVSQ